VAGTTWAPPLIGLCASADKARASAAPTPQRAGILHIARVFGSVDNRFVSERSGLFLPTPRKDPSDFAQWIQRHKHKPQGPKAKQDEYQQYLEMEHFPDQGSEEFQSNSRPKLVDLCAFWARYEAQYPSLARMAFDVLSIPALSSECERVFSSAKILIDDRRARMKEDIIEASECLRAWLQAGQCALS
jgi:hypothetical protein